MQKPFSSSGGWTGPTWQLISLVLTRRFQTGWLRVHFWGKLKLQSGEVLNLGVLSASPTDAIWSLWFFMLTKLEVLPDCYAPSGFRFKVSRPAPLPLFFYLMTVSDGAHYVSGPPLCLSGIVTFTIQTTCHSLVQGDFLICLCVLIFDHLYSNFWQPMSVGGLGLGHVSLTWFPSLLASLLLLFPWAGVSSLLKHKLALYGFQLLAWNWGSGLIKSHVPQG